MAGDTYKLNFEELERMVAERLEETVRLEFKSQLPESGKNDDLAGSLAAMANSEGGLIIYGIEEDREGRAAVLRPFAVGKSGERLGLVARTAIDEPVALAADYTVDDPGDGGTGYLVAQVPKSDRAPHLVGGKAWGRAGNITTPLTRRQIGELFARTPSFAEEFGLVVGKPGRVLVKANVPFEAGKIETRHDDYLLFENDGDTDVFDADWEWVADGDGTENNEKARVPHVVENPFPLGTLPAGAQTRVMVLSGLGQPMVAVKSRWRDLGGNAREQVWPTVW